jgi:anti-sigma factor RsiW
MRFLGRKPPKLACVELVEIVTEYFEGTLPERDHRALEHHLTQCDGCSAYVEQMRQTIRVTGRLTVSDVPEAGMGELLTAFRAYQAER